MVRDKVVQEFRRSGFDLLTVDEVAAIAKCSTVTIYRYINDGTLKATKVAGSARIDRQEVVRWLSRSYREASE